MKKVIIMRGVSGSGKSTYVQQNYPQAVICSADFYHMDENGNYNWSFQRQGFAHKSCKQTFELALINGEELVVVDNTNTRHKELKPYYNMALEYGYEVVVVRLNMSLNKLYGRNVHNVPDVNVKAMFDRMQPWEGEIVIEL